MNEQEPEAGDGIDPEQEAHIRGLLAEAGAVEEQLPADVSARLDETLAMLRAERTASEEVATDKAPLRDADPSNVVPLRRRWLPRAAGAAAAVIVLGVGGVAAVQLGTDNPSSQDSAATGGAASDARPVSPGPSDVPVPSAGSGSKSRALRESAEALRAVPAVSTASFATDVAGLLRKDASVVTPDERADQFAGESGSTSEAPRAGQQSQADALLSRECPGPAVTDGAVANPVRVDGELAVLLVHPADGGSQLVEAWTCAGDHRLDSTQLTGADVTP